MTNGKSDTWICLKSKKKHKDAPSEILIDTKGNVFIDGIIYSEENSKYENLTVDVEKYSRMNSGEETQQMLKKQKEARTGEIVTIKDIKSPNRSESTTVKF